MKKIILLIILFVSFANFAKDVPPALFVLDDPDDRTSTKVPLTITALSAEVVIHGNLAQTEITLTFKNHTNRNLEGEFYYPLPPNSATTGYALDIKNKMVEGVAIEKNKATYVFETIKNRNIDPGLVEWENKNCFKTRVFPIFPQKTRTIRVQYLTEISGDKYSLPLNFKQEIKAFKFKTIVKNAKFAPEVNCGNRNISFEILDADYIAQFSETDIIPNFKIGIKLNKNEKNNEVLVERDQDNNVYFKITDFPKLPAIQPIKPEKINILWDASGSRAYSNHAKEFKVLSDYFAKSANKTIAVNVQVFNFTHEKNAKFAIKNGNCKELLEFLRTIKYDGGTQFGEISVQPADFYLFFTDGISTFGNKAFPEFNSPVFICSSSKQINIPYMKKLGAKTGGTYFNLLKDLNIVEKIGIPTVNFISAEYYPVDFANISPSTPKNIDNGFILTGRLLTRRGEIKINYGTGEKIMYSTEHKIDSQTAVSGALLRKYQAMKKLDELMIMPKRNKEKILSLGMKHALVTPYTSLIVLEELDDYIEFKIPPPKSQKDMREEYFVHISGKGSNPEEQMTARIDNVIKAWNNRIMWWNTVFKYQNGFKYKSFNYDDFGLYDAGGGGFSDEEDFFDTEATFGDDLGESSGTSSGNSSPPANKELKDDLDEDAVSDITVKQWNNSATYLTTLAGSSPGNYRGIYWKLREKYRQSPAFFLGCADFFYTKGDKEFAIQILSNIAEFNIENAVLQRIMACKYSEMGNLDLAIQLLENTMVEYSEDPDIYRDLALFLARQAEKQTNKQKKKTDYKRAVNLLYKIVISEWRSTDIAMLALMDINHMIPKAKAAGIEQFAIPLPLIREVDADLRIVISHFSGMEEMHCYIEEPSDEKISCVHPLSLTGGIIAGGEGSEEYFVRKAMKGTYRIKTSFKGALIEKLLGTVILKLDIYTNYGRPGEKYNSAVIHLKKSNMEVEIGKIKIKE